MVVSHETRRVAAARPRRHTPSPVAPVPEKAFDPDQEDALIDLFGEALGHWSPRSAAALRPSPVTAKRSSLDVDFWYLDEPGNRYIRKCSLELRCDDLTGQHLDVERMKLVHVPLVYDNWNANQLLEEAVSLVAPGGAISAVLEMPEEFAGKVSRGLAPSAHRRKAPPMHPVWLEQILGQHGFKMVKDSGRRLKSGRRLWLGIFAK